MHTIHDPRKTVMNPHNRVGITEYIIHYITSQIVLHGHLAKFKCHAWQVHKHCSGYKGSVGSPCHASTLQATDWETGPSLHRRHRTPHHHHRILHHNLTKLIARDKAVSTFWNCTRKPPKGNKLHAIWL
jgi:hypothetical protein